MEVGYQSELNWNPRQSSLAEQTTQDESHYSLLPPPLMYCNNRMKTFLKEHGLQTHNEALFHQNQ